MSILIGIACDGKDCYNQIVVPGYIRIEHSARRGQRYYHHELRRAMKDNGWRYALDSGRDYCPECREQR